MSSIKCSMNTLCNCNSTILLVAMIVASSNINAFSAASNYFMATARYNAYFYAVCTSLYEYVCRTLFFSNWLRQSYKLNVHCLEFSANIYLFVFISRNAYSCNTLLFRSTVHSERTAFAPYTLLFTIIAYPPSGKMLCLPHCCNSNGSVIAAF